MRKFLPSILLIVIIVLSVFVYKDRYSIPMPVMVGEFSEFEDGIRICGLMDIKNEKPTSLMYSDMYCDLHSKTCIDKHYTITKLGKQVTIFPFGQEYQIKKITREKILFESGDVKGEIDINEQVVNYTSHSATDNHVMKSVIITDNDEIIKKEKEIIKKVLRKNSKK